MNTKNKINWKNRYVASETVATAVFNLLEAKGYKVNRKKGLRRNLRGEVLVKVA